MPHQTSAPIISIIMPTYNRADFLEDTIRSIQNQTYPAWELIIVDDGSSDNTQEILNQIIDKRIQYYKGSHIGMEHARNTGLQKAKGEFIGFMDSDDFWATDKLQKQVSYFAQNSEVAFCLTGGYEFERPGYPLVFFYRQKAGTRRGSLFVPFFQSNVVAATSSLLFRRQCLDIVSFREQAELAHIHFILSLSMHFEGVILYEHLSFRRLHQSNYSTINSRKRHYDGIKLIKSYKEFVPRAVFIDALLKSHINYGENCLHTHEKLLAIGEFMRAWKYNPLNIVPLKKIAKAIVS
jgi:glycosyltransferase involved in cell wall biosynthesis